MNRHVPLPFDLASPGSLTRVLLDGMTEGVSLSREDGIILYTNPAEDRIFGYGPGELLGRHVAVQNAYPPEENGRTVAAVIGELRAHGIWQGTWLNRRKDGTSFTSRTRISTVLIEGAPHWLCVREDITREHETQARLAAERSRLNLATEAAGIGIWDWDRALGTISLSDRARAIFGLSPTEEVPPSRLVEVIHPEDRQRMRADALRALDPRIRSREPIEYRVIDPSGTVRWLQSTGGAIFEDGPDGPRALRYLGAIQDVTDRRALEEAERTAAQRLRLALDAGRMAVWDMDLATGGVTGSRMLNRLLGFPEDQPLDPSTVRACYWPGEQERLEAEGQATLARGETSLEAEFRYLRPDGELCWLHLRCDLLFDPEGRPTKVLGVLSDETGRHRDAEDLRASEARLQLASTAAGAGVWDWDLVTDEVRWSPQEYALLGVDPATPPRDLTAAWVAALHPEDRDAVVARSRAARRSGGTFTQDYRVLRPDGTVRWIRSHAITMQGPDGQPTRMVGIELDATPEHEQAQALRARAEALEGEVEDRRREQDRFHALSNDLFAVAGFDGQLKAINPAWSRLLGYSEAELLDGSFLRLIHPDDHPQAAEVLERLRGGTAIQQFQDRLIAQDGRVVWVDWSAVAEGDRFYAVGRDITREREREEILRQTQKMEALGQLTGGIAHDFNNLLQAVQGSFALIARRPDEAQRVRELAEHGLEAAKRGGALTAQLLAFSRARQIEMRPVAVSPLLDGLQDLLRRSLGPLVAVELDLPGPEVTALADPTQLEMAVLNLAINARDAMPDGGAITIRATPERIAEDPELRPGEYVRLELADIGQGMPPDVARRAFEPFFTTKGLGKGTGLGLSQVYAMARQAGGTARIESRFGCGTTVRLWLPRAEPDRAPASACGPEAPVPAAAPLRALVIDDDPDVRRWLVAALRMLGHEVLEAEDGPSGLAALERAPDLALVDFAMPGMTGAEVAAALRERRPDLPVILTTGYADLGPAAVAPVTGLVLRKPFGIEDLDAALREATARPALPVHEQSRPREENGARGRI